MSETVTAAPAGAGEQQLAPTTEAAAPAAPETSVRETLEAAYEAASGPERDESGKFAADKNSPAPEEAAAPERPAPPEGWGDKAKVDWNRLPRSVQDEVLSRTAAPPSAPPDPLAPVFQQLRGTFQGRGIVPEQGITAFAQIVGQLYEDPRATLQTLAKQFGVTDLGADNPPKSEAAQQWEDPAVTAVKAELADIKAWKAAQEREAQSAKAAVEQRVYRDVTTEIESFAKDKPDFAKVRPQMAALMQSGQAKDLADAYDQAIWANPQTRAAQIERTQKAAEAERAAAAAKARTSASVNVRSDTTASPAPARDIRDTMSRTYDAVMSG